MVAGVVSLDRFRLEKLNRSLDSLFTPEEMADIYNCPHRTKRLNTFNNLSIEEIDIINKFHGTRFRIKHYIFFPFDEYEQLFTISIYKNGLLYLSQIFYPEHSKNECQIYNPHLHTTKTLADAQVIEVIINNSLVLLNIGDHHILNICDTALHDYLCLLS